MKKQNVSRLLLAGLLASSAVQHLRKPEGFYSVVPPYLCNDSKNDSKKDSGSDSGKGMGKPLAIMSRRGWVVASAIPEFAGAAGLLLPATRKAASTSIALMFMAFTAGHLSALQRALGPKGTPEAKRFSIIRLPLQIPLVIWAWSARRG